MKQLCSSPKVFLSDVSVVLFMRYFISFRQPNIVDLQLLRIGNFVIVCIPAEFTTMAGRRLREALADELKSITNSDFEIVIAGLTNGYSSYVTTYQEYQVQRYEGASTLYGPHTLQAYIQVQQLPAGSLHKNSIRWVFDSG